MRTHVFVLVALLCAGCHDRAGVFTSPSPAVTSPPALNMTGVVRDLLHQPIRDVKVAVADGPAAGLSTLTDSRGEFALSAPASSSSGVTLITTREGYADTHIHVMNTGYVMIYLQDAAFAALAGPATLFFVADAACTQLPSSVRARSYSAVLSTTASSAWALKTELSGADFYDGLGTMSIGRNADTLAFGVSSWDAFERWLEDYPIVERLTRTSHLALSGSAAAAFPTSQQTITAPFNGTFSYCAQSVVPTYSGSPPTCAVQPIDCTSTRHQLTFRRP